MIVLKLGGSLLSSTMLPALLRLASEKGQGKVVIVPGGGVFADQVRLSQQQLCFNDRTAHYMAILAMQQVALVFQGLQEDFLLIHHVDAIFASLPGQVLVWSPLASELDLAGIPASWDVTSDTLAAWLAVQLAAEKLILVKSLVPPAHATPEQLMDLGVLDKAFAAFVENTPLAFECISDQQLSVLDACLQAYV